MHINRSRDKQATIKIMETTFKVKAPHKEIINYDQRIKGKKVFETAFESYFENGFRGGELKQKALSQYTNWAAQEWEKPHEYSDDEIPFFRGTPMKTTTTL